MERVYVFSTILGTRNPLPFNKGHTPDWYLASTLAVFQLYHGMHTILRL